MIDMRPRPTILLRNSNRVIAQNGWNSAALYRVDDGQFLHAFPAKERVEKIAVTPDEESLLIACADGSVSLWSVETGEKLWHKTPSQTGLGFIHDASFAQNGKSFIVTHSSSAVVFDTQSGKRISNTGPMGTMFLSAALSPDGSTAVLVDLLEDVYTFDLVTGKTRISGLKGGQPVRYSVDGKFFVCRNNNSGSDERLQVVTAKTLEKKHVGQFRHITFIRPMDDGTFHITAITEDARKQELFGFAVGVKYFPDTNELKQLWQSSSPDWRDERRTDFRIEAKALLINNSAVVGPS